MLLRVLDTILILGASGGLHGHFGYMTDMTREVYIV